MMFRYFEPHIYVPTPMFAVQARGQHTMHHRAWTLEAAGFHHDEPAASACKQYVACSLNNYFYIR